MFSASSPVEARASATARAASAVPSRIQMSLASRNDRRSRYASIGSTVCRVPMPLAAWNRSSTARFVASCVMRPDSSAVISACV